MKKKLQVALNDETWGILDTLTKEANFEFINGSISLSDVVNEIILNAKTASGFSAVGFQGVLDYSSPDPRTA